MTTLEDQVSGEVDIGVGLMAVKLCMSGKLVDFVGDGSVFVQIDVPDAAMIFRNDVGRPKGSVYGDVIRAVLWKDDIDS